MMNTNQLMLLCVWNLILIFFIMQVCSVSKCLHQHQRYIYFHHSTFSLQGSTVDRVDTPQIYIKYTVDILQYSICIPWSICINGRCSTTGSWLVYALRNEVKKKTFSIYIPMCTTSLSLQSPSNWIRVNGLCDEYISVWSLQFYSR